MVTYATGIVIALSTEWGLGKHIYAIDPATLPVLVPNYLRVSFCLIMHSLFHRRIKNMQNN